MWVPRGMLKQMLCSLRQQVEISSSPDKQRGAASSAIPKMNFCNAHQKQDSSKIQMDVHSKN